MRGSSGGVAVVLKNHFSYSRLDQHKDTPVDTVVLTVRLGGINLVVTTSYVRPDDIVGLRKLMKFCKTNADKSYLNGDLFLVTSMQGIPFGWTNRVSC